MLLSSLKRSQARSTPKWCQSSLAPLADIGLLHSKPLLQSPRTRSFEGATRSDAPVSVLSSAPSASVTTASLPSAPTTSSGYDDRIAPSPSPRLNFSTSLTMGMEISTPLSPWTRSSPHVSALDDEGDVGGSTGTRPESSDKLRGGQGMELPRQLFGGTR